MSRYLVVIILILSLMVGTAHAQTKIAFNGIGGHVGFAMPEDPIKSTIGLGARADLGTFMKENVKLAADVFFWSSGEKEEYYEWSWSQFYVSALAIYFLGDANAALKPYVGGGLGMVFGSWESKYTGNTYGYNVGNYSSSDSELCIHLLAGVQKALSGNLTGFAEISYILGGFDTMYIHAGALFNLSK